jgi:hypothetical protein
MAEGAEWPPPVPRLRISAIFRSVVLTKCPERRERRLTNWREWGIIGVRWSSLLRRDSRKTAGCCGAGRGLFLAASGGAPLRIRQTVPRALDSLLARGDFLGPSS